MNAAFTALLSHAEQTTALEQASALLDWDHMTQMPARGAAQRSAQSAAIHAAIHARLSDPQIGDWLGELEGAELPAPAARNVALIRRSYDRATKVPGDLATAMATAASAGYAAWTEAREAGQFEAFVPALSEVVSLAREQADHLAQDGQSRYDA
ncbi:MAG: carboxypeptidase M32, partial [Pseudomonadota bacterium]